MYYPCYWDSCRSHIIFSASNASASLAQSSIQQHTTISRNRVGWYKSLKIIYRMNRNFCSFIIFSFQFFKEKFWFCLLEFPLECWFFCIFANILVSSNFPRIFIHDWRRNVVHTLILKRKIRLWLISDCAVGLWHSQKQNPRFLSHRTILHIGS